MVHHRICLYRGTNIEDSTCTAGMGIFKTVPVLRAVTTKERICMDNSVSERININLFFAVKTKVN